MHDKLLVVLSETSVASSWVASEVESAFEKERSSENNTVLFPIRLDEAVMKTTKAWAAEVRRARHIGDFSHWHDHNSYETAFAVLVVLGRHGRARNKMISATVSGRGNGGTYTVARRCPSIDQEGYETIKL